MALGIVAYACTNYVGVVQVYGDNNGGCSGSSPSGTCTTGVSVTGNDAWNGAGAMTQTVNATVSKASKYVSTSNHGKFYIKTSVSGSNSLNPTGSDIWYDVNTIPIGYTSHTTWGGDPNYDCMDWILGGSSGVKNVGSVKIHTDGTITAATDNTLGTGNTINMFNSTTHIAGPFPVASNETSANSNPAESGVCLSDATSNNGNQMPLTLV